MQIFSVQDSVNNHYLLSSRLLKEEQIASSLNPMEPGKWRKSNFNYNRSAIYLLHREIVNKAGCRGYQISVCMFVVVDKKERNAGCNKLT